MLAALTAGRCVMRRVEAVGAFPVAIGALSGLGLLAANRARSSGDMRRGGVQDCPERLGERGIADTHGIKSFGAHESAAA